MNIKIVWHNYYITILAVCKYIWWNKSNYLTGEKKPPLCKERWHAKRDGKIVKETITKEQSLSRLRRQLPLHKGAFLFTYGLSIFPTSTIHLCPQKHKIRYTSFEIYRIFENHPLEWSPIALVFFIVCLNDSNPLALLLPSNPLRFEKLVKIARYHTVIELAHLIGAAAVKLLEILARGQNIY